jgi:hypothetical protein
MCDGSSHLDAKCWKNRRDEANQWVVSDDDTLRYISYQLRRQQQQE